MSITITTVQPLDVKDGAVIILSGTSTMQDGVYVVRMRGPNTMEIIPLTWYRRVWVWVVGKFCKLRNAITRRSE